MPPQELMGVIKGLGFGDRVLHCQPRLWRRILNVNHLWLPRVTFGGVESPWLNAPANTIDLGPRWQLGCNPLSLGCIERLIKGDIKLQLVVTAYHLLLYLILFVVKPSSSYGLTLISQWWPSMARKPNWFLRYGPTSHLIHSQQLLH